MWSTTGHRRCFPVKVINKSTKIMSVDGVLVSVLLTLNRYLLTDENFHGVSPQNSHSYFHTQVVRVQLCATNLIDHIIVGQVV